MEYTQVTNPVWGNENHTIINCDVLFTDIGTLNPFTADPSDTGNPASAQIFDECKNGDYGIVGEYVPPQPYVPDAQANKATAVSLLQETDWATRASVSDPAISNPYLTNQTDWFNYQNTVRQIALNPTAGNLDWPVQPTTTWSA